MHHPKTMSERTRVFTLDQTHAARARSAQLAQLLHQLGAARWRNKSSARGARLIQSDMNTRVRSLTHRLGNH